jgi:hypothetical protein
MHEITVTMLGSRGVGKTSLLTAMSAEFKNTIGSELKLEPEADSKTILDEHSKQLNKLLTHGPYQFTGGGIEATREVREYFFGIGRAGGNSSLKIRFVDYPGEYISARGTPEQNNYIEKLLRQSAAALVTIDAPALIEEDGQWHERINQPKKILEMFEAAYQGLNSPRLVFLAPIRCEKYLKVRRNHKLDDRDEPDREQEKKEEELARNLKKVVIDKYADLLKFFRGEQLERNVTVVITPVQTLGTAIFSHIKMYNDTPVFFFRKWGLDVEHKPQDCKEPLRYLLRFLLKLHHDRRVGRWWIFNFLRQWLNSDAHLKRAVEDFAADCKTSGGFEVLQGNYGFTIQR